MTATAVANAAAQGKRRPAFDRLTAMLSETSTNAAVNQALNKLFADAQSLPDFDPDLFAKDLKAFQTSVSTLEPK